ncbi:hypothetical protein [Empedobacter sp. UBA5528]|uniref:hypothetical protein n=1 Tax=Empedobacter sp. UBA5528 TaxID=1946440 RepID=UPI0025B9E7B1|nr:hypothetical protein [Empedobacter sp. UBA5528]
MKKSLIPIADNIKDNPVKRIAFTIPVESTVSDSGKIIFGKIIKIKSEKRTKTIPIFFILPP